METRSASVVLSEKIQLLEIQSAYEAQLLKEQFNFTYEQLKPANLIKNSMLELITAPHVVDNLLSTAMGLATGYLSRKLVVGGSGNFIRKIFGLLTQMGVTNSVAQHPEEIKSIGQYIFHHLLRRREKRT